MKESRELTVFTFFKPCFSYLTPSFIGLRTHFFTPSSQLDFLAF